MNRPEPGTVLFSRYVESLASGQVWEYDFGTKQSVKDVAGQTHLALNRPLDFPPIESAIVAGDRVALAVDPNVPQICEVLTGVLKTLAHTDAGDVDIVLWDEATDETIASIADAIGDSATIIRHDSGHREALRYLAADKEAEPIYLNRALVDADFVLPIICTRPMDALGRHDLTGVFPSLADASTRVRHRSRMHDYNAKQDDADESQIAWLLGVHLVLTVTANPSGMAGEIIAGTIDAISKHISPPRRQSDQFPPAAPLIVASLDGDKQQQTWANAARALVAASRYVADDGTIVLWTEIDSPPAGTLARLADLSDIDAELEREIEQPETDAEGFLHWDDAVTLASTIYRIANDHRILIHTQLDRETIEPIGLGAIDSAEQLVQLSQSYESCGILRAAQFAGSTIDAPHRPDVQCE
ncbi:MAG: hypothetical protein HKN47_25760 [Pirellulaceae bacterium]|nr:hypothetical protein [Pirellulaceae bacterium]